MDRSICVVLQTERTDNQSSVDKRGILMLFTLDDRDILTQSQSTLYRIVYADVFDLIDKKAEMFATVNSRVWAHLWTQLWCRSGLHLDGRHEDGSLCPSTGEIKSSPDLLWNFPLVKKSKCAKTRLNIQKHHSCVLPFPVKSRQVCMIFKILHFCQFIVISFIVHHS